MKAPNGKPSNLTPEQYKLVRTPKFKAWFGDWENDPANASKVVDENGEPLVVYHGTYVENPFYIFDFNKADLGFHFGTYEQAKNRSETKLFFKWRKSIVNSFFLNVKNLFETSDIGEWEYPQRYIDMFVSDGLINESDAKKNGFYRLIQREENKKIREYLLNKYGKFVGFVYNNKYEGKGKSFIVLNPNQIKLADGTNTTFDSKNDDIRFMSGGALSDKKYILFREEFFTHLIAGKLGNIKGFSEKNGNKDINDLAIEISLLNQQHKAYEKGRDIIDKLYLLAKKIDENTGLKTSKGITYNYIIKRDIFSIKELYDKIDEEALPLFNELADGRNTTFDGSNPDIRYSKGGQIKYFEYTIGGL